MHFAQTIEVPVAPDVAFAYVSNFANAQLWDPGVAESRRVDDGELRVGSQFELVAEFRGKRLTFLYTVTVFDPPRRIVLSGDGAKATSVDTVAFSASEAGTAIAYEADIRLTGDRKSTRLNSSHT